MGQTNKQSHLEATRALDDLLPLIPNGRLAEVLEDLLKAVPRGDPFDFSIDCTVPVSTISTVSTVERDPMAVGTIGSCPPGLKYRQFTQILH